MTDFLPPAQPQIEVPISEGFAALPSAAPMAQDAALPTKLITSPVPVPPEQVSNVEQATPADWHPNDPIKRGLAAGHLADYADSQPGGLSDAKRHWGTFAHIADSGLMPETGDTAETMRVWKKFRNNPESLKPAESNALKVAVGQIGQATNESPDLQFDPVGKVASVGARGEVRVSFPAKTHVSDLSLQPLASTAIARLRNLAWIGQEATQDVPLQDLLSPFLGLSTTGKTKDLGKLEEAVNGLAQELDTTPEHVRAAVAAGWGKLLSPTEPWQRPFAVRDNGINPAEDALHDGLSANLISAMGNGVAALDFSTQGDPAVTVQPEGGLAVSASPTERNARLLRHLYPAFTQGGVTAWLPGEPAQTEAADKLGGAVYSSYFLQAFGGHPLFKPGQHIVYDASDPSHPGTDLGPVVSQGPALKQDRLRSADIDPNNLPNLLKTNQWALIPGNNSTKASLVRSGYHPIAHKVGDNDSNLVFGISPEQARKHTTAEIVANDGTYSHDGFRPGGELSFDKAGDGAPSVTRLHGGDVSWHLSAVDRTEDPTDAPGPETETQRVRRRALTVTGDLEAQIADIERLGGQNLHVYAHRNQLDGFKTAWEHVYTDGVNVGSVVVKKAAQAAHTGPVLVRSTDGLADDHTPPQTARRGSAGLILNGVNVITTENVKKLTDLKAKYLKMDGTAIISDEAAGDAQIVGGRIVVHNPSPESARLVQAARQTGLPDSAFKGLPAMLTASTPPSKVTISGDRVHPIKQTRPSEDWANRFGVVFDPAWREAGGIKELPSELSAHLANVFEAFHGQFKQAADMWGLTRIGATSSYSKSPAYTEWGDLGGSIGLSAKHWSDPKALTGEVARLQDNGTIVSNVPSTPAYFLAHELGHVTHGALQFGTDGSGARKELLAIRRSLGKDGVSKGLSHQAWQSPEEMIAEAVAETVLASNPRPLAREIVNVLRSAYSRVESSRSKVNW